MTALRKHQLKGKRFGSLKVVQLWGSQSSNLAWVYWCRACGHVGKRLACALVNRGVTACPACNARPHRPHNGWPHKKPDPVKLLAIMADAPLPPLRGRQHNPPGFTRRLSRCNWHELQALADQIASELRARHDLEESSTRRSAGMV